MSKVAWLLVVVGLAVLVLYGTTVGHDLLRKEIVREVRPNVTTTRLTRDDAWMHLVGLSLLPAIGLALLLWTTASSRVTLKARVAGTLCLVYGCLAAPAVFLPFRDRDKIVVVGLLGALLFGAFLAMLQEPREAVSDGRRASRR